MLILLYGVVTLFITLAFVLLWTESLKSAYKTQRLKAQGKTILGFAADVKTYLDVNLHKTLLSLPILGIVTFTIMPLIFMILVAFTNYDRDHLPPGNLFDWVGLKNFSLVLNFSGDFGKTFWPVLGWTLIWAVFATFLNYILGMILAITINRKDVKGKGFWRFCFVLSVAVPQFVTLLTMRTMLQNNGAINILLQDLGFLAHGTTLPFFTNVMWARITLIIVNVWVGIPYTLLTMTGILQNIPADLYESAKVDGANAFITFFKITLPYMLFITAPALITQFIGNINNFNVIYLLTGGNPATLDYYKGTAGKTDLLVTWLFKLTIDNKDYSYGAVIGILVFILSIVFSLVAYRQTGSYKNEEGFQ
jgi:arabinogalactan oligomer/maltooligosaccharide transport system permease protein